MSSIDGNHRQGQIMLYDNSKAVWTRIYAVLSPEGGFSMHATGSRGSQPFRPLIALTEVKVVHSLAQRNGAAPTEQEANVPHMHCVIFALELTSGELILLRTSEPKGTNEWASSFLRLCPAKTTHATIDQLRVHRSLLAPQIYSQLFRNRPGADAKAIARTAHNCRVPAVPASTKALMPRRSSLSAQTPSRNGANLPARRAPLVPLVSAATHHQDPTVPTEAPSPATAAPEGEKKTTTTPTSVEPPAEAEATPPAPEVTVDKENAMTASPAKKEEKEHSVTREASPLATVSPGRAVNRLNRLKGKTQVSDTCTVDEVVTTLRKQVESLTRRNIDLQVSDLNNQSRILDLEQMLSDSQDEAERLKDRVSMFQRQADGNEVRFEERLKSEKEDLVMALKDEVAAQLSGMRKAWEEKEHCYLQRIAALE